MSPIQAPGSPPSGRLGTSYLCSCSLCACYWVGPLYLFFLSLLWFSFHGWGNWCTEWLSHTPTVTRQWRSWYLNPCFSTLGLWQKIEVLWGQPRREKGKRTLLIIFFLQQLICNFFLSIPKWNSETVDWIMLPLPHKYAHTPVTRTWESASWHSEEDFADVIKFRMLRKRDYPGFPGLSRWAWYNLKGPYMNETEG